MRVLFGLLAALLSVSLHAQTEEDLLEKVRKGEIGQRADQGRQLQAYRNATDSAREAMLEEARERRDQLQKESRELEETARANDKTYDRKINELRTTMGPNAAMFGTLQGLSDELIGLFRNSPTTLQYPDREEWLAGFKARMEKASEIFSVEELERLWFMMQQEITASARSVSLTTEVLGESGNRERREVVRIGKFGLVSRDPEPAYLTWDPTARRASLLQRQPEGGALDSVDQYLSSNGTLNAVAIDPTGGSLLSRLVDAPSISDRIDQGGLIGRLIILLGLIGVAVAIAKLVSIMVMSAKVAAQKANLDQLRDDNPLGRMMRVYERNKDADPETLEMRLGEAILEERPKVDRYVSFIKVIAAVAPLMGLMGTVIGMIATFQAITLFGTGDPKTMAGGISQALVTTVLGLTVAIPTVLLHALVSSRATSLVNTLKHQTAGLIAERMEAQAVKS